MSDIAPVYGVQDWGSILSSLPSAMSNIRSQTVQQADTAANIPVQQATAQNIGAQAQLAQQDIQSKALANQFMQFRLQQLQQPQMPMPDINTGAGPTAGGSPSGQAPATGDADASAADGGTAKGPPTASGADNPFDPDAESQKMDRQVDALRVNKAQTPYEAAYYQQAVAKDLSYTSGGLPSPGFTDKAKEMLEKRIANETARKQLAAQKLSDTAYNIADAPSPFRQLARINPAQAAKLEAIGKENGWTQKDLDDHARQYATMFNNKLAQVTGDKDVEANGATLNSRTLTKPIGELAQTITPVQAADINEKGLAPTKVPFGTGEATVPTFQGSGLPNLAAYRAAVTGGAGGTPAAAAAASAAASAPAGAAPAPPSAGASGNSKTPAGAPTLPGVDIDAIPKLDQSPTPKVGIGAQQTVKTQQEASVPLVNKAKAEYSAQAQQAAKNNAVYTQLTNQIQNANPRYYGPSSTTATALANFVTYLKGKAPNDLITQTEVDKYLTQQGVLGAKNLLGAGQQLRQQELLLLISQANPNVHQPLDAIKNLVAFGKANNDYDTRMANTALAAIGKGADPNQIPTAFETPGNSRSDFVQARLKQMTGTDLSAGTGASAAAPVKLSRISATDAASQYAALDHGAHYVDPSGTQRTKP